MKIAKIVAVVIVVISFCLFIRATDFNQVLLSVRQIGYQSIYLLIITFAAYWSATIGWKYCIGKSASHLSIRYLFVIRHIGEMVSLINPASVVGGEAVKVYLLQNKGIGKPNIISSILVSRIMMALTQLILLILTLGYVFFSNTGLFHQLPVNVPVVFAALLLLIIFVKYRVSEDFLMNSLKKSRFHAKIEMWSAKLRLKEVFCELTHFFKNNKKGLIFSSLFFLIHWTIGSLEIYFILKFLGIKTELANVLFVDMGIIVFKSAGAFIPGQIGIEELGNKIMLDLIGIADENIWITVSVLRRSRQFFWILCGLIFYLFYGVKLKMSADFVNGNTLHQS